MPDSPRASADSAGNGNGVAVAFNDAAVAGKYQRNTVVFVAEIVADKGIDLVLPEDAVLTASGGGNGGVAPHFFAGASPLDIATGK